MTGTSGQLVALLYLDLSLSMRIDECAFFIFFVVFYSTISSVN